MNLKNKKVVVTGGAKGIGKSIALRLAQEGANIAIADILEDEAEKTARFCDALHFKCDVTKESDIKSLIDTVTKKFGSIDLFVSNAGICLGEYGHAASAPNKRWKLYWDLHVMSHVYASRILLPSMIKRGHGYFLQVVSAAGLLSQIGDAAYSATKHAAVGFAESLAITHADDGIKVSIVCPQFVATSMLGYNSNSEITDEKKVITADIVADSVLKGLNEERFLILPHLEVQKFMNFKTHSYDKWIKQMQKLRRKVVQQTELSKIKEIHKFI